MRSLSGKAKDRVNVTRRAYLRSLAMAGIGAGLAACGVKPESPTAVNTSSLPRATDTAPPRPTDAPTLALPKATDTIAQPVAIAATETPPPPSPTITISASTPTPEPPPYMVVSHGEDPAVITERAIQALGGIERFVKQGADVIIKPNICTDYYTYEYAATTNPVVVATLVRLALGAGARRVRVMDLGFAGTPAVANKKSGIQDAVIEAGGEMELMNSNKYKKVKIPGGKAIKEWYFYTEVLNADVVINVPIAKHHSLAKLTLGAKNLMGVILDRGNIHYQMGDRLADIVRMVRPELTVLDAVRILMRNGPTGGNLDDVKLANTVIASQDIVAVDAYGATLFGMKGEEIDYIKSCAEQGLGTLDLNSIKIEEISA